MCYLEILRAASSPVVSYAHYANIEQNLDKIVWNKLSYNVNATRILEQNIIYLTPECFEIDIEYMKKIKKFI